MALVLTVDPRAPDPNVIEIAARHLREGRLVAFPTETVYGLGAHALDREALRRVFAAKGRPSTDPLIVHIDDVQRMAGLTEMRPAAVEALAARFWPGPLTLVVRRSAAVPDEVTAGLSTVAIRVPSHPVALTLLRAADIPVAAPSANLFSRPSPTQASHVIDDLGDRIDVVLDGGPTTVGLESTVLDLTRERPTILRPGAVTIEMLRPLLPGVEMQRRADAAATTPMASPGLLEKHYSPKTPLTLYEGDSEPAIAALLADAHRELESGRRVGVLASAEDAAAIAAAMAARVRLGVLGSREDPDAVAARLYAALRELDASGVDVILALGTPIHTGVGAAIADRLRRAAAGRIVTGRDSGAAAPEPTRPRSASGR
jgi:L-threonylcarbamoyladenylate synthase